MANAFRAPSGASDLPTPDPHPVVDGRDVVTGRFVAGMRTPEVTARLAAARSQNARRKKAMREAAQALLSCGAMDLERAALLRGLGVDDDVQGEILLAMVAKATNGDADAAKFLRDTAGDKPKDAVDVGLSLMDAQRVDMTQLTDEQLRAMLAQAE